MDKSYVTLEQHRCMVCVKDFDTGNILMDKRIKPVFHPHTVTGWGMCPECSKFVDEYITLVGVDQSKSTGQNPGDVWRTGDVVRVRRTAWLNIFNTDIPDKGVAWVQPEVVAYLKAQSETSDSTAFLDEGRY